ncbi:MAG: gamma-glutamyltransferase family protein, partial [Acidobacteriales bacterium]|nr:gamma-glutamyltransferase family protein [Terriglobales bacterium]
PRAGIHSVTVPGAVDGWKKAHQRFGRLPWKDLFTAAIYYAEHGYPVPEIIQAYWEDPEDLEKINGNAESRRVFLPNGNVPEVGAMFSNPDIAKALRLLAERGPEAFYKGEIAQRILETSRQLGGTMQADDLAEFSSEWVEPISTDYRGWTVYELPPNLQGMAALEMLNIMEVTPAANDEPQGVAELHKKIEAMKLAYADLYRYNADPKFAKVPVKGLLAKDYAKQRAGLIKEAAACKVEAGKPDMSDTTYLATVDKQGNIASFIQSNYSGFGSGVTVLGMGFPLQNRGGLFTLERDHPNVLAPRKRPFHTIIPGFMSKGDVHIGFGIMGGANQPVAHAQFVSNLVDYGMNIQQALEAPRFTVSRDMGCEVPIESRVKPEVLEQLKRKGHQFDVRKEYSTNMGRGQAVLHNAKRKVNYGASDPRADGSAEPEPLP